MTNFEFKEKLLFAQKHKTVYANGMFGQPITESIIAQKSRQLPNWYNAERQKNLRALINKAYFGFDCICLIKSVLWGWLGDLNDPNGGAKYNSDGVPDLTENGMLNRCSDISSDFSKIEIGEYLWTDGHCGVYIGDGLAVECTPKWNNGVQITAVHNIAEKQGYNGRKWRRHGKLPCVKYITEPKKEEAKKENTNKVTVELSLLKKGAKGEEVKTLQTLLKSKSYNIGEWGVDGDFGQATKYAVEDFQAESGLDIDGIVGKDTWSALLKG